MFQKLFNKNEKLFIITMSRVLSFIGEILRKIRRVLEKSKILKEESILPRSNGTLLVVV